MEFITSHILVINRVRLYQPELGRFLQPDPKEFGAGDYNLYRYCHNDPVNHADPLGFDAVFMAVEQPILKLGVEVTARAYEVYRASGPDGFERGMIGVQDAAGHLSIPSAYGTGTPVNGGTAFAGPQKIFDMPRAPAGTHEVINGHVHTNGTPMSPGDKHGANGIPRVMTNDGERFQAYIPRTSEQPAHGLLLDRNGNIIKKLKEQ